MNAQNLQMQQSNIDLSGAALPLKSPRGVNGAHYGGPLAGFEENLNNHQMDSMVQGLKVREPFHNHQILAQKDGKSQMPFAQPMSQKENIRDIDAQQR